LARHRRARGEGSVVRRKDGTWEYKLPVPTWVTPSGRKSFYAKSKAEAIRRGHEFRLKIGHASNAQASSVEEFLAEWLENAEIRPSTYELRSGTIRRHIVPYIGQRPLLELDIRDVKNWLQTLAERRVGARTRNVAYNTLSNALSAAAREERISKNPCASVPAPRVERKTKRVLDPAESHRLIQAASPGLERAIITLALNTGMRQGELFALTWGDVDLDRAELTVEATLTEAKDGTLVRTPPKTQASRRRFKLPVRAAEEIRRFRETTAFSTDRDALVFTDAKGKPLRKSNFVRRLFLPLLSRAGLPRVTFHSLRHTSLSILIAEGTDPVQIARRAGHTTTRMTMDHYGHLFSAQQRCIGHSV
jgi:integrase